MSDDTANPDATLAARVARLPQEIEPAADLWPAIAASWGRDREDGGLDALLGRLEPEIGPDVDLWPAIESRLERPAPPRVAAAAPSARSWLAIAASLAAVTIIASIAGVTFMTTERTAAPPGDDVARAVASIRAEMIKVQGERLGIEESLQRDADNLALHALWAHAYQTELGLAGKAAQLIEDYQGV